MRRGGGMRRGRLGGGKRGLACDVQVWSWGDEEVKCGKDGMRWNSEKVGRALEG
jgi:hypothetical protein